MREYRDLYNVFYTYGGEKDYQATTDNFDKWLKVHNEERASESYCGYYEHDEEHKNKECICYESADSFTIEDVDIILFNKEEK